MIKDWVLKVRVLSKCEICYDSVKDRRRLNKNFVHVGGHFFRFYSFVSKKKKRV